MGRILKEKDVEAAVKGGSVYAAGGGGWADHGRMLGYAAVSIGKPELVSIDELDANDWVATAAAIGAPASTTPWEMRGVDYVKAVQMLQEALGEKLSGLIIGQNGKSSTLNAANVVPSKVRLLIDARAELRPQMERFLAELGPLCLDVAGDAGVTIAPANVISDNHPTPGDALLLSTLEESCDGIGARHRRMASGAGHDTAWMGRITRSAMIFIPCLGGRSHAPEEWAENDDIALGAAVLFEAVKTLDKRLQEKV